MSWYDLPFWRTLDLIVSLVAAVSAIIAVGNYIRHVFRVAILRRQRAKTVSGKPMVIVVSAGNSILGQVESYLEQIGEDQLEPIEIHHGWLNRPEQYDTVLRKVRQAKRDLTESGATEAWLFFMGPGALAFTIGALLDDWIPIKLYNLYRGKESKHDMYEMVYPFDPQHTDQLGEPATDEEEKAVLEPA